MMHFLDFSLIYAHLSRNFVVVIYALFPQNFLDWKVKSADFFTYRMYACQRAVFPKPSAFSPGQEDNWKHHTFFHPNNFLRITQPRESIRQRKIKTMEIAQRHFPGVFLQQRHLMRESLDPSNIISSEMEVAPHPQNSWYHKEHKTFYSRTRTLKRLKRF